MRVRHAVFTPVNHKLLSFEKHDEGEKQNTKIDSVIAVRLSQQQAQQVAERAKQSSQTSSQWGRQAILDGLQIAPGTRVVVEELMALRKIFLALKLDEIHAQPLTEDRLRFLVEQAENTKAAMTESRIHSMRSKDAND